MNAPMRIYGDSRSGNCYKIQWVLHYLQQQPGVDYEWQEVDVLSGYTRSPEYLQINPTGQVPALARADGGTLSQSNAIIYYLAQGSDLIPDDPWAHAQMLAWQNFEQYTHEPSIAVARFIRHFLGEPPERAAEYLEKRRAGERALARMEHHLAQQPYFGDGRISLADVSLYAYTHVAPEGGFDLSAYPAVRDWLARVAAHPRHRPMQGIDARPSSE